MTALREDLLCQAFYWDGKRFTVRVDVGKLERLARRAMESKGRRVKIGHGALVVTYASNQDGAGVTLPGQQLLPGMTPPF